MDHVLPKAAGREKRPYTTGKGGRRKGALIFPEKSRRGEAMREI